MIRRVSLQTCLIAAVSGSITFLSAIVAFAGLANQSQGIQIMALSSMIYGVAFAWLESGYILLRGDDSLPVPAVYSLFALIRIAVILVAGVISALMPIASIPLWKLVLVSAGLSSGYAVMSCLRSGKFNCLAVAYLTGVLVTVGVVRVREVQDTVELLFVYAVCTLVPVLFLSIWRSGSGSLALANTLFQRTRAFFIDLPITSIVENADRMLISALADHRVLIAYNSIKVFCGIQREFNKLIKQLIFHHIYDAVRLGGSNRLVMRFLVVSASNQVATLAVGLLVYVHFKGHYPTVTDTFVAVCVSTAYTLASTHTVAVAHTLHRPSPLFTMANVVSLSVVGLVGSVVLTPIVPAFLKPEIVYAVAGCYLLFYALKTLVLFSACLPKRPVS